MVGGVSPRGEPPWGTIGAREQGGFGTGLYDLVSPNPALEDAQMRQRHTARVQRPSGQTPEAKRPESEDQGGTHKHGTQNPASPTRRRQQDNSSSHLGGRNPSVLRPGIFLDELTGSRLVGHHPARVALGPGRTEEEKTERENKCEH